MIKVLYLCLQGQKTDKTKDVFGDIVEEDRNTKIQHKMRFCISDGRKK